MVGWEKECEISKWKTPDNTGTGQNDNKSIFSYQKRWTGPNGKVELGSKYDGKGLMISALQ